MRILINEKLSEHKMKTPEGFLVCTDAILARTGKQEYMKKEVFDGCTDEDIISIDRKEQDVFSDKTIASFEDKAITWDHPSENVTPSNYSKLSVGHVRNVRRSTYNGEPVMVGDLVITDADAIEQILNGDHTELSCGYDCDIVQDADGYKQTNIRGNHVALCEQGRAGIARIVDSVKDDKFDDLCEMLDKAGINYSDAGYNPSMFWFTSKAEFDKAKALLEKKHSLRTAVNKHGHYVIEVQDSINDKLVDSKITDSNIEGVPTELLLSASEWLEDKTYIERKYHVKIYNITSSKGLTVTGSRQDLEKLYKDYHLKDYYGLKIVDSKLEDAKITNEDELEFIKNAPKIYKVNNHDKVFVVKTISYTDATGYASDDGGKTWYSAKTRVVKRADSTDTRHQNERRFSSSNRIEIPFSHISYCYYNHKQDIGNETIDHKDGDHMNDNPKNLEPVSNVENKRREVEHRRQKSNDALIDKPHEVYKLCKANNWYTEGFKADYENLLENADQWSVEKIASDIASHSKQSFKEIYTKLKAVLHDSIDINDEKKVWINAKEWIESADTPLEAELIKKYFKTGWYNKSQYETAKRNCINEADKRYKASKDRKDYDAWYSFTYYLDFDEFYEEGEYTKGRDSIQDNNINDAKWSGEWASFDELGIDSTNKKAVTDYTRKIAAKYGLQGKVLSYDGYPELEFRGDKQKLKKLILNEYCGKDKDIAEDEYEYITDSVNAEKRFKQRDSFDAIQIMKVFKLAKNALKDKKITINDVDKYTKAITATLAKDGVSGYSDMYGSYSSPKRSNGRAYVQIDVSLVYWPKTKDFSLNYKKGLPIIKSKIHTYSNVRTRIDGTGYCWIYFTIAYYLNEAKALSEVKDPTKPDAPDKTKTRSSGPSVKAVAKEVWEHLVREGFSAKEVWDMIKKQDSDAWYKLVRHGHSKRFNSDEEVDEFCKKNKSQFFKQLKYWFYEEGEYAFDPDELEEIGFYDE